MTNDAKLHRVLNEIGLECIRDWKPDCRSLIHEATRLIGEMESEVSVNVNVDIDIGAYAKCCHILSIPGLEFDDILTVLNQLRNVKSLLPTVAVIRDVVTDSPG